MSDFEHCPNCESKDFTLATLGKTSHITCCSCGHILESFYNIADLRKFLQERVEISAKGIVRNFDTRGLFGAKAYGTVRNPDDKNTT